MWRALESRPLPPSTITSDTGAPLQGQGWDGSKEGHSLQDSLGSPPRPPSLRSVPVDAGVRCAGRGSGFFTSWFSFYRKVTREAMSGPNTDPSPKVKVWEVVGEVIRGDYLPLREKGFTISICVSTFCASTSPSLYFRKLAL